jgi:hypothetical protein
MGIRSEVGIAVNPKYRDSFLDLVTKIATPELIEDQDRVLVKIEFIKWYEEEYREIRDLMEWLRSLPDDEWGFIEICEDRLEVGTPGITTEGSPYKFSLYWDCKIVTE